MKTLVFFGNDGWVEDPDFRHEAWQADVAEGNTLMGYMAWVVTQHQAMGHAVDPAAVSLLEQQDRPSVAEEAAYPEEDWLHEVEELNTRRGYWEWVASQAEANEE